MALEPRTMSILVHLAERARKVISADELIEHVWGGIANYRAFKTIHRSVRHLPVSEAGSISIRSM